MYTYTRPKIVVGNLVIGERYIEPQGSATLQSMKTGITCKIEFKSRGWTSSNLNGFSATIKDKADKLQMKLEGKYTQQVLARDMRPQSNQAEQVLFEAPKDFYPANAKKYFNMNYFALQLNQLSEDMEKRLPPTDSRLRPDLRAWENGDFDMATREKARLEDNQRNRRNKVRDELKSQGIEANMYDEPSFYKPRFFVKGVKFDATLNK